MRTQESEIGLQGRVEGLGWGHKRLVNERPKNQLSLSWLVGVCFWNLLESSFFPLSLICFCPYSPSLAPFSRQSLCVSRGRERLSSHLLLICLLHAELSFHSWCPPRRRVGGWPDVVPLLSCVRLSATPWTAARRASLSFTVSWSLLRLLSIESVMPRNLLILLHQGQGLWGGGYPGTVRTSCP